jgi:uncharacterized protein DUF3263
VAPVNEEPLSELQLDILELEDAVWKLPGSKQSEFRDRYPDVSPTVYTLTLLGLLRDRRAWEYADGKYAGTLGRIQRLHDLRMSQRGAQA